MKVDINKGICTYFVRNVLDGCIDYHDDTPLGDLAMNLTLLDLRVMPCLRLVIICLEFII